MIDGDPFAVWDELAGQLRDGDQGPAMAGSADACAWTFPDDVTVPGTGDGGSGQPVDAEPVVPRGTAESTTAEPAAAEPATGEPATGEPATGEPPTTTTGVPQADPYLAAVTVTGAAPDDLVDGVECSAAAPGEADGSTVSYRMLLRSGARWPATITLQALDADHGLGGGGPTAWRTSLEMQSRPGGGPDLFPGPGAVPASAAAHVPPVADQEDPEPGGPFGTEVNCFATDGGYHQLDLPEGASFVAGGFDEGTVSVVAVEDAAAAIADIQRQVAGDGSSEDGSGTVETLELADGGEVTEFSFSVSGGGGGCGAISSPDGRYLAVSVHGD